MKAISKKMLAIALAVVTVFSMSSAMTVAANAATSNVTVKYTNAKVKKASISKVSVAVDGNKAAKSVTVYLSGTKAVKVNTAVTVTVKGKKSQKLTNKNKVTYASSNKSVATVSSKGVITVKKAGKTTITVKSKANSKKAYKFTLTAKKGVKSMSLSTKKTAATMTVGDTKTYTATVKTTGKVKATVTASSSKKSVVAVKVTAGKKGKSTIKLTAKAAGKATITIGPKYGSGKDKKITVTVNEKPVLFTKVVFADKNAKKVDLKGKVTVEIAKDSKDVASVEKLLAAIGGDYTVKVADKEIEVKEGKATSDLSKILDKKAEKTDIAIECTKTIAEVLEMVEKMNLTEDVAIDTKLSVIDEKIGAISAISVKKTGDVTFTFANIEQTAFVKGGELYLVGDQVATLKAITTLTNNSALVKDFVGVTEKVR